MIQSLSPTLHFTGRKQANDLSRTLHFSSGQHLFKPKNEFNSEVKYWMPIF